MNDILTIENHGPLILSTNFWETPACRAGKILVSVNAGAFRVLLPASVERCLDDMRDGKACAISRGPWPFGGCRDAFEVLFDDESDSPFSLHLSAESFDRLPVAEDVGREWVLTVWTQPRRGRPHKALERLCRYRLAQTLPDLRPWREA